MKLLKKDDFLRILILIAITIIVCLPMISTKMDVYTDDGIQHISRAYGTFDSIKNGSFLGNVISNFSNNFGYSWNLFYGAFSTFGIIFFKIISGSYLRGYKLYCFICLLFSGITMYMLVKKVSDNTNVAVLAGALYIIAPYHLTDLYVRNAVGEFTSFVFIPLVFLGLYNLFNNEKKDWFFTIGSCLLVFTHNITCLYTAIFAFVYILINLKQFKNKEILIRFLINICLIVFISSCFLIPMIETKFFTNYRVFENDSMSTIENIQNQRISLRRLFVTRSDENFAFELGPYMIIMLAFSVMTVRILKKECRKEYIFFLVSGLFSMFMATKLFPWNIMPKVLRLIQFPWRCLEFSCFFFSIIAAINMGAVIKKYYFKDALIIITIAVIYVFALKEIVVYAEQPLKNVEEFDLGMITGMENECIAGMGKAEYLPTKAYNNRFYIATREDRIYAIEGKAVIENEKKNGSNLQGRVFTYEEDVVLELPYIYYPGYEITLDGMHINGFETDNGMLGIDISKNENTLLEVKYSGSSTMKSSIMLSIVGILSLIIYIFWDKNKVEN